MKDATKSAEFQKLYKMYLRTIQTRRAFSDDKEIELEYFMQEATLEDVAEEVFGIDIWHLVYLEGVTYESMKP